MVIDKNSIYYGVKFAELPGKLRQSVEALERSDITSAEILTREFLECNKNNELALRARIAVVGRLKDFQAAVNLVGRLLEIKGGSADLFFEGAYYAELGGNLELALNGYEKVLELEPFHVDALLGLGRTLLNSPGIPGADVFFARAYELEPENRDAAEFLALAYEKEADFTAGIPLCEEALKIFPESWTLLSVLANLWGDSGKSTKGLTIALKAVEIAPEQSRPYLAVSYLLENLHRPFEALEYLEKARKIAPNDLNICLRSSSLQRVTGNSAESLRNLQNVIRYAPKLGVARSNYLFFLHDINGISKDKIFSEHLKFGKELDLAGHREGVNFDNVHNIERRLKLGFLSSDFKTHSVAYFLYPLLCNLAKDRFKIVLFSNNRFEDEFTGKFKKIADEFISIRDISDSEAAEVIRNNRIDVLLELNGHTADNRLLVCSYRAAPVQVNWLGYPDTTGMSSVDYRIVDELTDPLPEADNYASEKLVRMSNGFLTYQPPSTAPGVSKPPFLKNSYITYGSFNNFAKLNSDMIGLWARLLQDNPEARLLLKNHALVEDKGKDYVRDKFAKHGVESDRLLLYGTVESVREHLDLYSKIDIGLDTFPYNGTTTTFEALYMGIPVISLKGNTHASRMGVAILSRVGLGQLVADTPQQYLLIAAALGRQQNDIVKLREGMRERLLGSEYCNCGKFAEEFSGIISGLFKTWIGNRC